MFWHVFAKIPRHTRQNAITEGDLECILTRNCEGTEQLRIYDKKKHGAVDKRQPLGFANCYEIITEDQQQQVLYQLHFLPI